MSRPRFVVRTVTGYRTGVYKGGSQPEAMSAHVCDSVYLYEVVKTFHSEDSGPILGNKSKRLGAAGAQAEAHAHAERLNRDSA